MIIRNCSASCKDIALFLIFSYLIDFLLFPALFRAELSVTAVLLGGNLVKIAVLWIMLSRGSYTEKPNATRPRLWAAATASALSYLFIFIMNLAAASLSDIQTGPVFSRPDSVYGLILVICLTVAAVLVEELFYRKILLQGLKRMGAAEPAAVIAAALLFSLGHIYAGLPGVIFSLLSGVNLGWLYLFSGNLRYPILVHLGYNFSALLFSGYLGM